MSVPWMWWISAGAVTPPLKPVKLQGMDTEREDSYK